MPDDLATAPNRVLKPREAAGYLGVCVETVHKLRRKGKIAHVTFGAGPRAPFGFRIEDLDAFILTCRVGRFVWDEDSPELPIKVVLRLLDFKLNAYNTARGAKRLKDRTPKSIRAYIERQLTGKVQIKVRRKYEREIGRLNSLVHSLRTKLAAERAEALLQ